MPVQNFGPWRLFEQLLWGFLHANLSVCNHQYLWKMGQSNLNRLGEYGKAASLWTGVSINLRRLIRPWGRLCLRRQYTQTIPAMALPERGERQSTIDSSR
jgi:hypothetical protein